MRKIPVLQSVLVSVKSKDGSMFCCCWITHSSFYSFVWIFFFFRGNFKVFFIKSYDKEVT